MVQIVVEVRYGKWQEQRTYEILECTTETSILDVKERAVVLARRSAAEAGKPPVPELPLPEDLELHFLEQVCDNTKRLRDYSICHDWIKQVVGFVLKPKFP